MVLVQDHHIIDSYIVYFLSAPGLSIWHSKILWRSDRSAVRHDPVGDGADVLDPALHGVAHGEELRRLHEGPHPGRRACEDQVTRQQHREPNTTQIFS